VSGIHFIARRRVRRLAQHAGLFLLQNRFAHPGEKRPVDFKGGEGVKCTVTVFRRVPSTVPH
jgi:hypothetical protein